jgi:hypothetical protein
MTQNDSQKREERLKMNPQDHETYYAPEAVKKLIDENASLKARIEELRMNENAIKYSVVDTVGGIVEGMPTHELNYLQRLCELVEIEKQRDRLVAILKPMREQILSGNVSTLKKWDAALSNKGEQV